jgi:hypothetical protein
MLTVRQGKGRRTSGTRNAWCFFKRWIVADQRAFPQIKAASWTIALDRIKGSINIGASYFDPFAKLPTLYLAL